MSYTQLQVDALAAERVSDPLGLGYAGMTDQQFANSMNATTRTVERTVMSAGEIMEHIDGGEFVAMLATSKARVDRVLSLGSEIIIGPGNNHNAVQELLAAFGAGSATIAALAAARGAPKTSRAAELGLPFVSVSVISRIP